MSQTELDRFRSEMTTKDADPYSVVLRRKKIPMALLKDSEKVAKMNLLETESFEATFGKHNKRKRPKMSESLSDYAALANHASECATVYETQGRDTTYEGYEDDEDGIVDHRANDLFSKGQSKRIWAELYKVLDSSDVVLMVVDARNVPGTRCEHMKAHQDQCQPQATGDCHQQMRPRSCLGNAQVGEASFTNVSHACVSC